MARNNSDPPAKEMASTVLSPLRCTGCENHADDQSGADGTNAFAHHECENVPLLRADRQANAHFSGPENDHIAHGAIDSHRSQDGPNRLMADAIAALTLSIRDASV